MLSRVLASQTDIALRGLERQGIAADQLKIIEGLMRQRDALEQGSDSKRKTDARGDQNFAAALSKGSKEAVASIQRGQFSGFSKTLESFAAKQLKTSEKLVNLTETLVDKAGGSNSSDDLVADFG